MQEKPKYSIVIPAFNEELVIDESYKRLKEVMDSTGEPYELIFIDDGSRDRTLEMLTALHEKDGNVKVLSFSRNFGHQIAVTCGLDHARGDAVVIIDADLQDPPEVILQMIEKWKEGYDVVYGKRAKRKGESIFKKITAFGFYRTLRFMSGQPIPLDTGDFRLMDWRVVEVIKAMPEQNRFLRGMVSWVGFKQTPVEFVRAERFAGETKYPLKKMIKLAGDGIISFSSKPIKLSLTWGGIVTGGGFIYLLVLIILAICGQAFAPWNWVASVLIFLIGTLFIAIGMLGSYVGRIYDEVKQRPLYIVGKKLGF